MLTEPAILGNQLGGRSPARKTRDRPLHKRTSPATAHHSHRRRFLPKARRSARRHRRRGPRLIDRRHRETLFARSIPRHHDRYDGKERVSLIVSLTSQLDRPSQPSLFLVPASSPTEFILAAAPTVR